MPNSRPLYANPFFHLSLGILGLVLDALTKIWARAFYSLPDGTPDYSHVTPILGDWLRFRLVYNENAAFGIPAQNLLPFLHPIVFYCIFYFGFLAVLAWIYFSDLARKDPWSRLGITLIISGGLGNTIDRLLFHKVTDFIDAEFFDLNLNLGPFGYFRMDRWPVFNLADSWIFIGGILLFVLPLVRRTPDVEAPAPAGAPPAPRPPESGEPDTGPGA